MKTSLCALLLALVALLTTGCQREKVDQRRITSYSVEAKSEASRLIVAEEFETFLVTSGMAMQKDMVAVVPKEGFQEQGKFAVQWCSMSEPFSLTVEFGDRAEYLAGDIRWSFRGSKEEWLKLKTKLQKFQKQIVEWFERRTDIIHSGSSFWDGSI
ncbi:hypothetical protein [Rubritalea sp.]|uniref:hypothetical protein n=1 Tax=Rubritalea sp. TaxID=2109375 RepID=UPI003EFAE892